MKEELKQVKSFAELKVADYVELRNCGWCGRTQTHRGLLTGLENGVYLDGIEMIVWLLAPTAHTYRQNNVGRAYHGITQCAIGQGRVFLINTGLEDQADTSTKKVKAKPKKLVDIKR